MNEVGVLCVKPILRLVMDSLKFKGFFWNCQGCRHVRFRNFLSEYRKGCTPNLAALFGTKISGSTTDKVIARLGFKNSFRVEAVGFAGGIWLLWNDDVLIKPLEVHNQFIHIRVWINGNQQSFLCIAIMVVLKRRRERGVME